MNIHISLPISQIIFQIFILPITYAQRGKRHYHHFTRDKNQTLKNKNTSFNSQLLKTRVELGPNPLVFPRVLSAVLQIEILQVGGAEMSTPLGLAVLVSWVLLRRKAPAPNSLSMNAPISQG